LDLSRRAFPSRRQFVGRFLDESERGAVEAAELGFAGLVLGELHEVAAGEKVGEEILLRRIEPIGGLQVEQEFLGGPVRRAEVEALFEVEPQGVGDGGAERLGLGQQRDIRGPVPLPPELLWLWVAGGALLGGLLALWIWNKWFRTGPLPPATHSHSSSGGNGTGPRMSRRASGAPATALVGGGMMTAWWFEAAKRKSD
jgi:hypothetical protein